MRREAGFTLIELLCAMTILALVMGVSLRILAGGTANAAAARDYGLALTVAQAHLAQMQTIDKVAAGERSGRDGKMTWRESISPADIDGAVAAKVIPWRLESDVRMADGRAVHLSSLRLERRP